MTCFPFFFPRFFFENRNFQKNFLKTERARHHRFAHLRVVDFGDWALQPGRLVILVECGSEGFNFGVGDRKVEKIWVRGGAEREDLEAVLEYDGNVLSRWDGFPQRKAENTRCYHSVGFF